MEDEDRHRQQHERSPLEDIVFLGPAHQAEGNEEEGLPPQVRSTPLRVRAGVGGAPVPAIGEGTDDVIIVKPSDVDTSVDFACVGGLSRHLDQLREIVFLPLVQPALMQQLGIQAPRGVLFYGAPGTGKTLVARALAGQAAKTLGRPLAFFARKGADLLSKWAGEAERHLQALFEAAQKHSPSIIFFDEIDGLAPVRN